MAHAWTRDLDLSLAQLIRLQWGGDIWDSRDSRNISWDQLLQAMPWPESFTKDTLKERWQENFRKWVTRPQQERRANVVSFDDLFVAIGARCYDEKLSRRNPELSFKYSKDEVLSTIQQPFWFNSPQPAPPESQLVWFSTAPASTIPVTPQVVRRYIDGPSCDALSDYPVLSPALPSLIEGGAPAVDFIHTAAFLQLTPLAIAPERFPLSPSEDHVGLDTEAIAPPSGCESSSSSSSVKKRRAEESCASSPSADSPASLPSSSPAPSPVAAFSPGNPVIAELLDLMDWPNCVARQKVNRIRGQAATSREKHKAKESERRNNLADAIEELGKLVPQRPEDPRPSKLRTLMGVIDYGKRLQDVACVLLEENKRLAAAVHERAPMQAEAPSPGGVKSDVARLLAVSLFMVWIFAGTPGARFSASVLPHYHAGDSRQVLSHATSTSTSSLVFAALLSCITSVGSFAITAGLVFLAFLVIYVFALLQDMPRVPAKHAEGAQRLLDMASVNIRTLFPAYRQLHVWNDEVLRLLGKSLPRNAVSSGVFLGMQMLRIVMQRLKIGLYIESILVHLTGRKNVASMEALCYTFATMQFPSERYPNTSLVSAPMLGCLLAAVADSNLSGKTDDRLRVVSVNPYKVLDYLPRQPFLTQAVLWLAFSGSNTRQSQVPLDDRLAEWTTIRMAHEPMSKGRANEVIELVFRALPTAVVEAQIGLLALAGRIFISMRKFDQAFLVHSTAFTLGKHKAVCGQHCLSFALVLELQALGRLDDARSLLRMCEDSLNSGAGVYVGERVLMSAAKIACMEDRTDYPAIMAHAAKLLSCLRTLGLMPFFNLVCLIEAVIEGLMPALEIDPKSNFYVAGHRDEIVRMVNELIVDGMTRRPHWPRLVEPIEQRIRGWLAYVQGDKIEAIYHFKRSLLAAEVVEGLEEQAAYTLALMERLSANEDTARMENV